MQQVGCSSQKRSSIHAGARVNDGFVTIMSTSFSLTHSFPSPPQPFFLHLFYLQCAKCQTSPVGIFPLPLARETTSPSPPLFSPGHTLGTKNGPPP